MKLFIAINNYQFAYQQLGPNEKEAAGERHLHLPIFVLFSYVVCQSVSFDVVQCVRLAPRQYPSKHMAVSFLF